MLAAGKGENRAMPNELAQALHRAGVTDVRTDSLTVGMYSTDASIYRIPPRVVLSLIHI